MTLANTKTSTGMQPNVAGLLCYLLTWITGIIFFIIEKENKFVRFHAMQSIMTFGVLTVIDIIFSWTLVIPIIVGILMFLLWLFLMINAYQGKMIKLPIVGKLADKYSNPASQPASPAAPPTDETKK